MRSLADDLRPCLRTPADSGVWENFLAGQKRLLAGIVYTVARRFGVESPDEIDDAVQEACLKISSHASLGKILDRDDSSLELYVKALIANSAHDYFRGQRAKKRDVLAAASLETEILDGALAAGDIENDILLNQLEDLATGDSRGRRVFQLYYRFGWTAKEIAAIPHLGLTAKGVESLILRLTSKLREKMQPPECGCPAEKESPPHSS